MVSSTQQINVLFYFSTLLHLYLTITMESYHRTTMMALSYRNDNNPTQGFELQKFVPTEVCLSRSSPIVRTGLVVYLLVEC